MIKIIAGVSLNGVMGDSNSNSIPWHYPEDLKHFRSLTLDQTVIMGKNTWQSLKSPLKNRKNVIISSSDINFEGSHAVYHSLKEAVTNDCWLIGGKSIYQEGLQFADQIHLTIINKFIDIENPIMFPWINPLQWSLEIQKDLSENCKYVIYNKNHYFNL